MKRVLVSRFPVLRHREYSDLSRSEANTDLIVVGGGILGAAHAYHALQRGLRVILLERHGEPRGATVRNFGQVVPSGMAPRWQALGRQSLEIYKSIQAEFDISIRPNGTLYLASDEDELQLIEELCAINHENDYESELWTTQQCLKRLPPLKAEYCRGGLYFPEEVSVNPGVMIGRLLKYLDANPNFQCLFNCGVTGLDSGSGGVTATTASGKRYRAEKAILCNGSEFGLLYPELFRQSDLQAVKLQMMRLRPIPDVSIPGNVLTGLSIRRYESFAQCPSWEKIKSQEPTESFWKKWGVHILFKQEADGSIILGDSHEYATVGKMEQLNFEIRQDINDYFVAEGRKIFELPNWEIESAWIGTYCQTNDPSGVFTRTIDEQIHVVTGIGGKGMTSSAGFSREFLRQVYND